MCVCVCCVVVAKNTKCAAFWGGTKTVKHAGRCDERLCVHVRERDGMCVCVRCTAGLRGEW